MDYEQLRNVSREDMISRHLGRLDVGDIADFYTLGYILQLAEESNLPAEDYVYQEAGNLFDEKVSEITLAGICTLARELLGNGFSVGREDVRADAGIVALATELISTHNPYLNEATVELYEKNRYCAAKSIQCPPVIAATLTGLKIAAIEALQNKDFSQVPVIAEMAGTIAATVFESIGRCDWAGTYGGHDDPEARAAIKVGNWVHFANLVAQAGTELASDSSHGTKFAAIDQIIHAQHGGSLTKASMLDRSSIHPSQAKVLLDSKDYSTNFLIELESSEHVKRLASLAPGLSPFSESKVGILNSPELANISGKAKGLNVLKLLGYNVPFYVHLKHGDQIWLSKEFLESYRYDDSTRWAVRSSANLEDSRSFSFAGIFHTVLDVPTSELNQAVELVSDSENTEKVAAYCALHGIDSSDLKIEHVIQEFKEPVWSGVWIGNNEGGTLEWIYGRGEKLVDGSTTPFREVYGQDTPALVDETGRSVADICKEIELKVGSNLDLEFAMTEDGLQWVQMRPVTAAPPVENGFSEDSSNPFEGRGLSGGIATGISFRATDPFTYKETGGTEKIVFVGEDTRDDLWMQIGNLAAIITRNGGSLSHAAIVSREMGIPFVAGIDIDQIPQRAIVEVNGYTGTIAINSASKLTLRALAKRLRR